MLCSKIVDDIFDQEYGTVLTVMGRGLGVHKVLIHLLRQSWARGLCDKGVVLVLNCGKHEAAVLVEEMNETTSSSSSTTATSDQKNTMNLSWSSSRPKATNANGLTVPEREKHYQVGGVVFGQAHVLVTDLLCQRLPVHRISAVIIMHAHRMSDSSAETFAVRVVRRLLTEMKSGSSCGGSFGGDQQASASAGTSISNVISLDDSSDELNNTSPHGTADVLPTRHPAARPQFAGVHLWGLSENAPALLTGFNKLDKTMRLLGARHLLLWPRFAKPVKQVLDAHTLEVQEVHCAMTPATKELHEQLLIVMKEILDEVARGSRLFKNEELSVSQAMFREFSHEIDVRIAAHVHLLSGKTFQLLHDIRVLRNCLLFLLRYDCVSFLTYFENVRRLQAAAVHTTWLFSPAAERAYILAKHRVHIPVSIKRQFSQGSSNTPKTTSTTTTTTSSTTITTSSASQQQPSATTESKTPKKKSKTKQAAAQRAAVIAAIIRDTASEADNTKVTQAPTVSFTAAQRRQLMTSTPSTSSTSSVSNLNNHQTPQSSTNSTPSIVTSTTITAPASGTVSAGAAQSTGARSTIFEPVLEPNQKWALLLAVLEEAETMIETERLSGGVVVVVRDEFTLKQLGQLLRYGPATLMTSYYEHYLIGFRRAQQAIDAGSGARGIMEASLRLSSSSSTPSAPLANQAGASLVAGNTGPRLSSSGNAFEKGGKASKSLLSASKRNQSRAGSGSAAAATTSTAGGSSSTPTPSAKRKSGDQLALATMYASMNAGQRARAGVVMPGMQFVSPYATGTAGEGQPPPPHSDDGGGDDDMSPDANAYDSADDSADDARLDALSNTVGLSELNSTLSTPQTARDSANPSSSTTAKRRKQKGDSGPARSAATTSKADAPHCHDFEATDDDLDDSGKLKKTDRQQQQQQQQQGDAVVVVDVDASTAPKNTKHGRLNPRKNVVLQQLNDRRLLEDLQPSVVVLYDPDLDFIRQLEVHKAARPGDPLRVYLLSTEESVEHQMQMNSLKRENDAFVSLIEAKSSLVYLKGHEDDVLDGAGMYALRAKHAEGQMVSSRDTSAAPGRALLGGRQQLSKQMEKEMNAMIEHELGGGDQAAADSVAGPSYSVSTANRLIVVDSREFKSELPSMLHREGFIVHPLTLAVGDYVLTPRICVERKSLPDLIGSLQNNRVFNQAEAMCRLFAVPCLLIEFKETEPFILEHPQLLGSQGSPLSTRSRLCCLLRQFPRLRVLWSRSPHHTARLFRQLKHDQPGPQPGVLNVEATDVADANEPMELLRNLPGVRTDNLPKLLPLIRCVADVAKLTEAQLIGALGKVNGQQLHSFLHAAPPKSGAKTKIVNGAVTHVVTASRANVRPVVSATMKAKFDAASAKK